MSASGFFRDVERLRVDTDALCAWGERVGRPARPWGEEADRVIAESANAPEAWEALLLRGLVPSHWSDGALRFLDRAPLMEDGVASVTRAIPPSKVALRALSGDPEGAASAEDFVAEAHGVITVWLRRAGALDVSLGLSGDAVWTRAALEPPSYAPSQGARRPGRASPACLPFSVVLALRHTMISGHLPVFDSLSRVVIEAWAGGAHGATHALAMASLSYDFLHANGARLAADVGSPLGGAEVRSLPNPCAPIVDLLATGYLWLRDVKWAWHHWPPILAATGAGRQVG